MNKPANRVLLVLLLVASLVACNETSITGTFGSASIEGSVVLSGELEGSPADAIRVSVPGTGIETLTNAEGRFVLAGLAEGLTDLEVTREDGIHETVAVAASGATEVRIEVNSRKGRSRGARHGAHSVRGSVVAVGESSITIDTLNDGEVIVLVDEETVIYKGAVKLLLDEIEPGDLVRALVQETDEGLRAAEIIVTPRHAGDDTFLPRSIVGTIESIGDDELVVVAEDGETRTVRVDARTEFYTKNLVITFEDLEVGDRIKVFGMEREDHMIAVWIRLKPDGDDDEEKRGRSIKGEVTLVEASSLVLSTGDGEVTVLVTDGADIKRRGRQIDLSEIEAGDVVVAHGVWVDDTTFQASKLIVVQ